MTIHELENLIRGFGEDSIELHDRVLRDLSSASVPLFAINSAPAGERLELAGSGTLVSRGDSYWILTAAHVWEKKLKTASALGIALKKGIDHRFPIPIDIIAARGFSQKGGEEEWGPDLCLLRIPAVYVGTIEADKVAFEWGMNRQLAPGIDGFEANYLLGCPASLGTFSPTHAAVRSEGFLVNRLATYTRGEFDYFDMDAYVEDPSKLKSFRGVSGGGLWNVKFYVDEARDEPAWIWSLEGVAFYEFPIKGNSAIIRCHGPITIDMAISPR
jgi:hypothetical protein